MLFIAVVTRRPGLSLTLTSKARRLTEVKPVDGWLERAWDEQVIVLDLADPQVSLSAVESLRRLGVSAPLLVVSADGAGWSDVADLYPDVILLPLPLSASAVQSAISRAAELAKSNALTPAVAAPAGARLPAFADTALPLQEPPPPVVDLPQEPSQVTASPADVQTDDRPGEAEDPEEPDEPDGLDADDELEETDDEPDDTGATADSDDLPAPDRGHDPDRPAPRSHRVRQPRHAAQLVRALRSEAPTLPRLTHLAQLVLDRCCEAAGAEAAAVLVPDPPIWRVSAGVGLRPLEHRVQIEAAHWLVAEVVMSSHGLVIENTDIARTRLSRAPLASWPNLLVVPLATISGMVLLASKQKNFSRHDLARAAEEAEAFAQPLLEAMEVRDLARMLLEYADLGE